MPKKGDELSDKINEIVKEKKATISEDSKTDLSTPEEDSGYNKKDIQKMNHLIDIIDKK